jgi:fructuronate reductase
VTQNSAPASSEGRRLSRSAGDGRSAAPVRIVHLGLGNFSRAHQAWFTEHAPDAANWGIAGFRGRRSAAPNALADQEDLYTLIVQATDGDQYEVISTLSAVHAAQDLDAWRRYFASPDLRIVTSTVTEAGYVRGDDGGLDLDDEVVQADIAALKGNPKASVSSAPGKFVAGLLARRDADAGSLTIVPCDNVPENGPMVARVITDLGHEVDPTLEPWIDEHVSFVTTMVDRITPRATDADRKALLAATGTNDPACVVTEPYFEWVLSGEFAGGRPEWDSVGARFVEDIRPFETRKLWLLNGSHSLMAYAGSILGHETVAEAIHDTRVHDWVEEWLDTAQRHLELPDDEISEYRKALLQRFENPRIRHLLAQIAADGSQKVPIRFVPVLRAEREEGRDAHGATAAVAAWICHLRGLGAPVDDARADELKKLASGSLEEAVPRVLEWLDIDDADVTALVREDMAAIGEPSVR